MPPSLRYTGILKPRQEEDTSRYLFKLNGCKMDIDAEHYGNEFRFVNTHCLIVRKVGAPAGAPTLG